ncbi:MAG: hypothetical protein FWC82_03585, partial [Firmicutes bacterium]|nr:hypothetical protein [Bacillota bacterium]
MKKSKNFLFVLFVSVLLPAVFLLSACNYSGSGNVQTPANVRIVNDSLLGWVLQWNPSSPTAQYDVEIRNTNTNETSILRIAGTIFHTNLIGAIETEILYELRVSAVKNLPADRTYFSDPVYFGIPSPYEIPAELVALNG